MTVCAFSKKLNVPPAKSYQPTCMKSLHGNTVQNKTLHISYNRGAVSFKLKCKHCTVNDLHSLTALAMQQNIISQTTRVHAHTYTHISGVSNENLANTLPANVLQTGSVQFLTYLPYTVHASTLC